MTYWRDLPSMVVARLDGDTSKALLAPRFQEAIDEAAMRLGDTGSDDYLAGWRRSEWTATDDAPDAVLDRVTTDLDAAWPAERVASYLDDLGPSA
ncbi:MAG: virulence factor protein [Nocardioidaceae bacterium]|nr:virulence factor protein [Nocardioidaceae bacterium]